MKLNKIVWIFSAVLAISIGLYPLMYLFIDMTSNGLLSSKGDSLLSSSVYIFGFYSHIFLGGLALLIGWVQFSKKWRTKRIELHRFIGKIYLLAVLASGLSGLYISFYATGGVYTKLGFALLAIAWLFTSTKAYTSIKNKKVTQHQKWMIRSYALTFAAVTLRIYLPLLQQFLDFSEAYAIIAWLCWIPNLFIAEIIITKVKQ